MELERARRLTEELNRDKAEASSELTEAKRVSARARDERELAHQQSMEAEQLGKKQLFKAASEDGSLRGDESLRSSR